MHGTSNEVQLFDKLGALKNTMIGYEITSLLYRELIRWSTASRALALAYRPSVLEQNKP